MGGGGVKGLFSEEPGSDLPRFRGLRRTTHPLCTTPSDGGGGAMDAPRDRGPENLNLLSR